MKRFRTLTICAAAAALALGLAACSPSGGGTAEPATSEPVETSSSAPAPAGTSAPADTSESVPAPAPAPAPTDTSAPATAPTGNENFDFADECIDEHGNITLYALTELKGWQVATLLDQQQYTWEYEMDNTWTREFDGAAFRAIKETGAYTLDTYNEMNEKGGCIAAYAYSVVAGYPDAKAALSGNAKCVIEQSWFDEDGSGIAIVYGPSMKEYFVVITPYTESTALFTIFSKEAVGSGMADEILQMETGGSFDALWDKIVNGA